MALPYRVLPENTTLQNRYRVIRQLGQGGMGAIYLAEDHRLKGHVALKESYFSHDQELCKQFEREASLVANLRHAGLPRVIDHFVEAGGQYLVMEFIPGEDLERMLKRRGSPFFPDQTLAWADQLLDILQYLHTRRPPVIHRDIKPENIKLAEGGQVVLLDFGLAKSATGQLSQPQSGRSVYGYTETYSPPEQINGIYTDARSDLYSAAATLYRLMTATLPPSARERAIAIATGDADPLRLASEINPAVPESVGAALALAMSLRREHRYGSAAEMRAALQEANRTELTTRARPRPPDPIDPPPFKREDRLPQVDPDEQKALPDTIPVSPYPVTKQGERQWPELPATEVIKPPVEVGKKSRKVWPWLAAAGAVALIGVAITIAMFTRPHPNLKRSIPTGETNGIESVAYSSDGKLLASAGNSSPSVKLWDAVMGKEKLRLPVANIKSIAFSPDGKTLASGGYGRNLILWDSQTGELKHRLDPETVNAVAFSPDGTLLASGGSALQLWDARTGLLKQTIRQYKMGISSIAFSADGTVLAAAFGNGEIELFDARTGALKRTIRAPDMVFSMSFSPDGKTLAVAFQSHNALTYGDTTPTLKLWDAETGGLRQTIETKGAVYSVTYSPDGKMLAGGCLGPVKVWDAETGELKLLLEGHQLTNVGSVIFSPDGDTLVSGCSDGTIKMWSVGGSK